MKKSIVFLLLCFSFFAHAQIGIKAGLNFANVSNASSINSVVIHHQMAFAVELAGQ